MIRSSLTMAFSLALVSLVSAQVDDPTISPRREFSRQERADLASIRRRIARERGCPASPNTVQIDTLLYFDFRGDGSPGIVIDASTCNTGTAGPDVHAVFFRDGKRGFQEIPVPEADAKYYERLQGSRNCFLSVDRENGWLVATWWDKPDGASEGRSDRLVVSYRWDGRQFVVVSAVEPQ